MDVSNNEKRSFKEDIQVSNLKDQENMMLF